MDPQIVGQNIRFIRLSHDMTQGELAEKAGVSSSFISQVELGRRNPSLEILHAISKAFDISIATFFMFIERDDPFVRSILPLAYNELSRKTIPLYKTEPVNE